jgi:hypothetical protein
MAKRIENSAIAIELKKEYLKEHLDKVKILIGKWISELNAPSPFAPEGPLWGWQAVYTPATEQIAGNNHMLRRHLRSRTLWKLHTSWQSKVENAWHLVSQIREKANAEHVQLSNDKQRQYTEDYLGIALWQGFEVACGKKLEKLYAVPSDQKGVAYGAYKIEMSATSQEERSLIEKEHLDFIFSVAQLKGTKDLARLWSEVRSLQERMSSIAIKALKSNDILYVCTFCRHLWK